MPGVVVSTRHLATTCNDPGVPPDDLDDRDDLDDLDDLERVIGYRGAIDDRHGVTTLAPDLLVVSFWRRRFCAAIVRAAHLVGFAADPDDPVPGHEVSLAAISPRLYQAVQDDLGTRVWPQLREVWPLVDYHGLRDAFVIRYALGEQEELRCHHDVAQVSASVKLDDGYAGAELRFPRQGVDNASVPVGALLAWPSLVTHPHESAPLQRGVKHALTIWFELPMSGLDV
jgi:hypothetical protein